MKSQRAVARWVEPKMRIAYKLFGAVIFLCLTTANISLAASLTIKNGWNLVSIPAAHSDQNATVSQLFNLSGISKIYNYNNGIWYSYNVNTHRGGLGAEKITAMAGRGLWVKSDSETDITIELTGNALTFDPSILQPGWNLIGGDQNITTIDQLTEVVKNSATSEKLYAFNNGIWISRNFTTQRGGLTAFSSSDGLWLYAAADLTIAGSVESEPSTRLDLGNGIYAAVRSHNQLSESVFRELTLAMNGVDYAILVPDAADYELYLYGNSENPILTSLLESTSSNRFNVGVIDTTNNDGDAQSYQIIPLQQVNEFELKTIALDSFYRTSGDVNFQFYSQPTFGTYIIDGDDLTIDFSTLDIADNESCQEESGCREGVVEVLAEDDSGEQTILRVPVYAMATNESPQANDTALVAFPGVTSDVLISAQDNNIADANNLTFAIEQPLPTGISIGAPIVNNASGNSANISIAVSNTANAGHYTVHYRATDPQGASGSGLISIQIAEPALQLQDTFQAANLATNSALCANYSSNELLYGNGAAISSDTLIFSLPLDAPGPNMPMTEAWSVAFEFSDATATNYLRVAIPDIDIQSDTISSHWQLKVNGNVYVHIYGQRSNGDRFGGAPTFTDNGSNGVGDLLSLNRACIINSETADLRVGVNFKTLQQLLVNAIPNIPDVNSSSILQRMSPLTFKVVINSQLPIKNPTGTSFPTGTISVPEYLGGPMSNITGYLLDGELRM